MNTERRLLTSFDNLYSVAEGQAGYFTTAQARAAGFSPRQLSYYVATRRFARVRHGVYRLTHFPHSPHEDLFIAWLNAGPQAVISHDSALALYELSDAMPVDIHLIVPRTASRRRRGMRLHTHQLKPEDVTRYAGLPVTTVPRTLVHVTAAGLADDLVVQAIREAIERGLVAENTLHRLAEEEGGRFRRLVRLALKRDVGA